MPVMGPDGAMMTLMQAMMMPMTAQPIYILNAKYMCLSICQQYAIIRSKSLPGIGVTGMTGGLIIITDGGAGVATGCAVIGIIIACINVIIAPSGPIIIFLFTR
jgi:hypothetical protein